VNLVDELHAVARALRAAGITYAICGGMMKRLAGRAQDQAEIEKLEHGDEP
jgi:hypothetical protein